jgi:putative PIG3 family NAD(P)H quinone oxidoreductase
MRAIRIVGAGGPEVLHLGELPVPEPSSEEVLVKVEAAGVNRADLLQRQGLYPPPPGTIADVPGLEVAGVVAAHGPGVEHPPVGTRIMSLLTGGGYAEYVAMPATHVVPLPEAWSFEEAATVPEAFLTGHDAFERVELASGEHVLIHAVASGVGVALLQLAKAVGCAVAGTSRTAEKLEKAQALGLDTAIHVKERFVPGPALRGWANVVCDLVGGPYFPGDLIAAAPLGRIVLIGLTGGRSSDIDLGTVLRKRLTVVGTVLRSRSIEEKSELVRSFCARVMPLVERKLVTPVLDRVFPMIDAADAHRYIEQNKNFGSVVLRW